MGCHTWFFRPKNEGEKGCDYCSHSNNYVETEYSDLFRTYYQDTVLKSLNETLSFIKERNIPIEQDKMIKLKEFWDKYPDGIIEFG